MKLLVTGGAGYIGSQTCKELKLAGHDPVAFDNLVYGHRDAVKWGPLVEGDCADTELVAATLKKHKIEGVLHFAAFAYVGESVTDPGKYYQNNVAGTLSLLKALRECQVKNLVFSSTCATYGDPVETPMRETHPQAPINPYGASKWMSERIIRDFMQAYGMRAIALRYFNASGADLDGEIGECHEPETHLIPLAIQAVMGKGPGLKVFGQDYDTPDGTCIRDYIHVKDLALAHIAALNALVAGKEVAFAYNLGTGRGQSVMEVIKSVERVSGKPVPHTIAGRRAGDPPRLVADPSLAARDLGWKATITDIDVNVRSAWNWEQS